MLLPLIVAVGAAVMVNVLFDVASTHGAFAVDVKVIVTLPAAISPALGV